MNKTYMLMSVKILWLMVAITTNAREISKTKNFNKKTSFLGQCKRYDPKLNACARRVFNEIKEQLVHGIPELFLPPFEPLRIPEIKMNQDTGGVCMQSSYKGIELYGLTDFTVKELDFDLVNTKLKTILEFPKIRMQSLYTIDGKIMMLPIVGAGPCQANFTNVELDVNILCETVSIENQVYLEVKDIEVHYEVGNVTMHLIDLFNGDKALSESMNQYINDNWKILSEDLRPLLEKALREFIKSTSDKLLTVYTYRDLLPE